VVGIVTEVEFVRHARDRLRERLIKVEEVQNVLFRPTATYFDLVTGYFVALGRRALKHGHWLIVVYEKRDGVRRVISVLDTTKANEIAQNREARGRWLKTR